MISSGYFCPFAEEDTLESFRTETVPEPASPEEEHQPGFLRFILDVLETLILSVVLFAGINAISARIRVDGYGRKLQRPEVGGEVRRFRRRRHGVPSVRVS